MEQTSRSSTGAVLGPSTPASPYRNRNVKLALAFTFLSSLARNVWAFTVLSKYVEELTGSKAKVGIAEGWQGAAQAGMAVLSGILADYVSVDRTLMLGGVLGLFAASVTLTALLAQGWLAEGSNTDRRFWAITASLGFWGAYQGVWTTVLETALANSVPTGMRSRVNTVKFVLMQVAGMTGPAVALGLFVDWGPSLSCADDWPFETLRTAFVVGIVLCIPSTLLLLLFDDGNALGQASEAICPGRLRRQQRCTDGSELSEALVECAEPAASEGTSAQWCGMGHQHVAWILLASDMVSGFGSGLSIKFFPLYFSEELALNPCAVNAIYCGLPVFMALTSFAFQRFAERSGRVQACLLGSYLGSVALGSMAFVGWYGGALGSSPSVIVPIYLVSTTSHCCRPLKKSILMDYVTKAQRSRWNALDSVTRFGWSGSAVLGGYLLTATNDDYGTAFVVTAAMQAAAATLLWALLPLVPVREPVDDLAPKASDAGSVGA